MKKIFSLLLSSMILMTALNTITVKAATTKNPIAKELLELNDPGWNEFFKEVDLNSKKVVKSNVYLKVYEDISGEQILDKKAYTQKEYVAETQKPQPFASYNVASWLKVSAEIYPMYNNPNKASLVADYQWLQMPRFQQKELFTISTDTNVLVPGVNERVNAAFWPNIACPSVVGSYNNFSNPSKFEFDTNGVTFIQNLNSTEFNTSIKQQPNWQNYFSENTANGLISTKGNPKGSLGFLITRSNSTTTAGKITFTYNHQQVTINFNPTVSISSSGSVSIGGIGGGVGFDKAATTITYPWGSTIQ